MKFLNINVKCVKAIIYVMEYEKELKIAAVEAKANKKLTNRLHKLKSKRLDEEFEALHNKVFEEIDCLKCANCCKTTSPIFRNVDVERIAKRLRMSAANFEIQYLKRDDEDDLVLKTAPCSFLNADNTCSIYEDRPLACKEYPHTNRKRMDKILPLTLRNTLVCPAVSTIFERFKQNR